MIAYIRTIRNVTITIFAAVMFFGCGDSGSSAPDSSAQPRAAGSEAGAAAQAPVKSTMPPGGYAPKLSMPSNPPDNSEVPIAAMFLQSAKVPSAADVNVPRYPESMILSTMAANQWSSGDSDAKQLPGMILFESVLAFYKEQLASWQYKDFYGVHTFWDGPEGSNPLDITAGHSIVSISQIEDDSVQRALWPKMLTKIDMMYDKPGN
jgi:hypothetical protein